MQMLLDLTPRSKRQAVVPHNTLLKPSIYQL